METAFTFTLVLHIAAGFIAFVAAPVAMLVRKGGQAHRRSGRTFVWCMTVVCTTGIVQSVLHPNMFLFAVSGFSYYLVASGFRWVYRKGITSKRDVAPVDWLLLAVAAAFNVFLFGYGAAAIGAVPANAFGYVAAVFGLIGIGFVVRDLRGFTRPPRQKHAWLLHHMGSMVGGYIATVSAFSAVNFNFLPTLVQWLWPTILGVPLLVAWIGFYKRKFKAGKRPSDLVEVRHAAQRAGTTGSM